jgi:hypothetical protein
MSPAPPLDPDASPLRPTRAAPCAPFVCAPPAPRVALAPAVAVAAGCARANELAAVALGAVPDSALALVQVPVDVPGHASWLASCAALALELRTLEPVDAALGCGPSSLTRASRLAAALGLLGAFVGAVAFAGGEGALPMIGWLPGPLIGAAAGAGVLGLAGVALGAIAAIVARGRTSPRRASLAYVRVRNEDRDALLALVARGGGRVVACSTAP